MASDDLICLAALACITSIALMTGDYLTVAMMPIFAWFAISRPGKS